MQDLLVKRLSSLRAKKQVERLLKQAKDSGNKQHRRAFRTTGSAEDLPEAVRRACELGLLTLSEIAAEIDRIEENGAQHIFLFTLSEAGRVALTAEVLGRAFPAIPANPTPGFYSDEPQRRTYFANRGQWLVVKQVCTEDYEEREDAEDAQGRRVTRFNPVSTRAVHLLRVHPESGRVQIRLDRVAKSLDDTKAMALLSRFLEQLSPHLDLNEHLVAFPLWNGFRPILADRAETFVSNVDGSDPEVRIRFSNRRGHGRGRDVRDHPDFKLDGPEFQRDTLPVFWILPQDGDDEPVRVHTILRRITRDGEDIGKVYVAARVLPEELDHVLSRVRHFAG